MWQDIDRRCRIPLGRLQGAYQRFRSPPQGQEWGPTLPTALLISYASTLPARLTHTPNSRHSLPDQWSQDHEQNGRREQKQPTESVRGRKEELACYHFH